MLMQREEIMTEKSIETLVGELGDLLRAKGWMLTNVAGSSDWYAGGVVSYSNALKMGLLGVDGEILKTSGAVSEPCVRAMVEGVCRVTGAEVGVALSGIAGPSGGTPDKPVGTVWIARHIHGRTWASCEHFSGTRSQIKQQSARAAITALVQEMSG